MKYSKTDLIKRAMQNPDVAKTAEAIKLTEILSEVREMAVDCFDIEFCQEALKLFSEFFIDQKIKENLVLKATITSKGKDSLQEVTGFNGDLERLLLGEDIFIFEISYLGQTLISVKYFDTEENCKSAVIVSDIYFSRDTEKNNIIYEILKYFEKISVT